MKLRVVSVAEAEVDESAAWYDERQTGLGQQFIEEYLNTLQADRSSADNACLH